MLEYKYFKKYVKEIYILLILSIPVIFTQISQTAMGVVDTVMSSSVSSIDMAAVSLGTSIWLPIILFGQGLISTLTPIISHLNGSKNTHKIKHHIRQCFFLASILSFLVMALLYNCHYIINQMKNIDIILAKKSIVFVRYLLWGAPGYLFFQVLRCQCEGLSYTKPGMIISFIGLISNILLGYLFIYGKLGIPPFEGVGCGIATALVYWIMFLIMMFYTRYFIFLENRKFKFIDFILIKKILYLGLPLALSLFFEVTLFTIVALFIAPLGIVPMASHQIALNYSSLIFVFPLSISVAVTIRVGFNLGAGNIYQAKISAFSSIFIGIVVSLSTAIFTGLMKNKIALLYNNVPIIVSSASNLIFLSSIYQISDSIQVIGNGILRGYRDNKSIFLITFFSYWILGLPIGYILALTNFICPFMGPSGFWIGFIIGLTCAALLVIYRILKVQKNIKKYLKY